MKLNKLIVTFSSVLLVGTLAACGNKSAESQAQTSAHESSVVVKKSHKKSAIKAKAVFAEDADVTDNTSKSSKSSSVDSEKVNPDDSSSSSKALASSADELTEQQQAALTGWYAGNYAKTDGQPSANSKVGVTKASRSQMGTPALPTGGDTYYQMYWQDGYGDKSLTYTVKDGQVYIYDNNGNWQQTSMQAILDKAKSEGATGQISTVAGNTQITNEQK
ncbi:hypothetical protein [Ligilactobacillus salivarius]|uniref:Lipoprotein n=1 Tax=Ligilactobacillus salivarius SMXD51 TaxID=1108963 RepID=H7FZA4_9LACO|nr:hypothetical protein [Ligilactobacillus salivarius]EIA32854.1 hypothetical protein SMXD51_02533 [Ligilactobacillus salivarius SMXD51]